MSITFEALGSAAVAEGATIYGGSAGPAVTGGQLLGFTAYGGSGGINGAFLGGGYTYEGSAFPNGFMTGAHTTDGRMPRGVSIQVPGIADGSYWYEGSASSGGYFRVNPGADSSTNGYAYGGFARSFKAGGFMEGSTGYIPSFDRPRAMADTGVFSIFTGAYGFAGVGKQLVYETLQIGLAQAFYEGLVLDEYFMLGSPAEGTTDASSAVVDQFRLGDRISAVLLLLLSDGLSFGDSSAADYRAIANVREVLLLGGAVATEADADEAITLAILLGARTDALFRQQLLDTVNLGGTFASALEAVSAFVAGVRFNDAATPSAQATFLLSDELRLGSSLATAAEFAALLRESIRISLRLNIGADEFVAWTINSESKHLSSYTSFPVNGLAQFAGTTLASLDDGIYDLSGDTDDGAPIAAKLRFALTNLGTGRMKRLDAAYLGYTASGSLLFKTVHTTDAGGKVAYAYRLVPRQPGVAAEGRVQFARGLESLYWGFELHNINGSDFDLEALEVREMVMNRSVSGSGRRGGA